LEQRYHEYRDEHNRISAESTRRPAEGIQDSHIGISIGQREKLFPIRQLAEYIDGDGEFDIQTAGYTKCRFTVLAKRYVVRDSEVLHADLSGLEPIDE
jgi:hypothetical protein